MHTYRNDGAADIALDYGAGLEAVHGSVPRISVVIPALNEARNIEWVLRRLPASVGQVIVVDGRSTDDTIEVALQVRPNIDIVKEMTPGKGAALRAGFGASTGQYIVMLDADGSMDPAEIDRYVDLLESGFDLVKGSRFVPGGGSTDITRLRQAGNAFLSTAVNLLYGTEFTDLCYGFLAFSRDRLHRLALAADGFEIETEIVVNAVLAGLSIGEVPSMESPRRSGESNLRTFRDGQRVLRTLLRQRLARRAPQIPDIVRIPDVPSDRIVRSSPGARHDRPIADRFDRGLTLAPAVGSTSEDDASMLANDHHAGLSLVDTLMLQREQRQAAASDVGDGIPSVAVIICAYTADRWTDTLAAIASARRQTVPPDEVIVVVDHNDDLLDRLRAEDLGISVVESREQPGLSGARNTGVAAAHAQIVAFLDDDAVADDDWLEMLILPYADTTVFATGGAIHPRWDVERPDFPEEFNWVLGCTYRGMPTKRAPVRNVIGAGMSFRREAVISAGGFDHELGRVGRMPAGCEETELCIRIRRLLAAGQVVYEPRARVFHHVMETRTSWRYFVSRCYAEGMSKALLCRLEGRRSGLASEREYVLRTLPGGFLRALRDGVVDRDGDSISRAARIASGLACTSAGFVRASLPSVSRVSSRA